MWPFRRKPTIVPRVEVLNLQPRDFLVIQTRERMPAEAVDEMLNRFAEFTGIDRKRVIVVYNASLKVLREGEHPPPPVIVEPGRRY
jgi:hypothetical protein